MAKIPVFSADLVNSTYMDQMAKNRHAAHKRRWINTARTKQQISRGNYLGQVQMHAEKHSDAARGCRYPERTHAPDPGRHLLPPNDLDTLYMIYFPASITIELDGLLSCKQFGEGRFAKKKPAACGKSDTTLLFRRTRM